MDNRLVQVEDWDGGLTAYAYDGIGRLITTTLPNQVIAQNSYDAAHHLTQLRYTGPGETLLADFQYQVDGLGQRQVVTETLLNPAYEEVVAAFVAAGGLLVLEAENGLVTAGANNQTWVSQTSQSGYAGESYLRALPDIGQLYEIDELGDSPQLTYPIYTPETADYTVWIRAMAAGAAGDSLHLGLNDQAVANTTRLTGFDNQGWQWQSVTMSNTQPVLSLEAGADSLNLWMREDGLRLDRLLLVTDTNYIPTGSGPSTSSLQLITHTVPAQTNSHVIHYTYDNLYRLTNATYSGDISADYTYTYDPVGNMTAYTETVGTETSRVTRTFDEANRLQTSFDLEIGTTSYLYDDNGNLTLQIPPNGGSWLHYAFNQRNLMISHTLSLSGTSPQLQAAYSYDGSSNRVQQVDHTGTTPITTTYTNDIMGLAQVLVADDGTAQTHLLFGLDLISQDNGNETRYLLADGLGSVRVEMVDDAVATATTYEPFGSVLQQAGSRGTVYGFTGEQYDTSTEQLYLRAHYYNPTLHAFMGKDPWSGNFVNPQSMNGWSYVNNNPVNLMDPTGNIPFRAEYCKTSKAFYEYRDCVSGEYGLIWDIQIEVAPFDYQGEPGCWYGPVPYRTRGYTEGTAFTYAILGGYTNGDETVYDFATMERQAFRYHGGGLFAEVGGGVTQYAGVVHGFRSWKPTATEIGATSRRIVEDYKGWFKFDYTGGGPPTEILGVTGGKMNFEGRPDTSVYGSATYASLGIGLSTGYDRGEGFTFYRPLGSYHDYRLTPDDRGRRKIDREIISDISSGLHTPWRLLADERGIAGYLRGDIYAVKKLVQGEIYVYEQINYYSYGPGQSAANPNDPPQ